MRKVLDLKCPGCGGRVVYHAIDDHFDCESCKKPYKLEQLKLHDTEIEEVDVANYKCDNCHAEITVATNEVSSKCLYCGNTAIIRGRLLNEYRPDYIIPFKTEEKDIMEQFKEMAKKNIEIDTLFLDKMSIEKIGRAHV